MTARHYVVQTKPCHEGIAHGNLVAAGFDAYFPTLREEIRTRTKRLTVLAPMFPGYIFVRFDRADASWRVIASLRGVRCVMGADPDKPTAIPEAALAIVRGEEASRNAKREDGAGVGAVSAGDSVDVDRGVFEGFEGLIGMCTKSRGDRVRVLMTILGGAREVEMDAKTVTRRIA